MFGNVIFTQHLADVFLGVLYNFFERFLVRSFLLSMEQFINVRAGSFMKNV